MDNLNNISGNNPQNNFGRVQGGSPIGTPITSTSPTMPTPITPTPTPPMAPRPVMSTPIVNNEGNNTAGGDNKSSVGPIIGSIIVVLVIVLGGLYVYGQRLSDKSKQEVPIENISASADQATTKLEQQGSTDSLSEINADLNATDLNGLDAESASIDQGLQVQ